MNNGILLEVEKVVILFGAIQVAIILFDHGLFVVAFNLIVGRVHFVVDESLPLKEVLPPLLLLCHLL